MLDVYSPIFRDLLKRDLSEDEKLFIKHQKRAFVINLQEGDVFFPEIPFVIKEIFRMNGNVNGEMIEIAHRRERLTYSRLSYLHSYDGPLVKIQENPWYWFDDAIALPSINDPLINREHSGYTLENTIKVLIQGLTQEELELAKERSLF